MVTFYAKEVRAAGYVWWVIKSDPAHEAVCEMCFASRAETEDHIIAVLREVRERADKYRS